MEPGADDRAGGACGIGGFITSLSAVESLALARDGFYADAHFADLFASLKRARRARRATRRATRRRRGADHGRADGARGDSGLPDPIIGQLDRHRCGRPHSLNRVTLAGGRALARDGAQRSDGSLEVLVSEGFALKRGLKPGSTLTALVNGRQRTLVVVGTALSPEFVFAGLWACPTCAASASSGWTARRSPPPTT